LFFDVVRGMWNRASRSCVAECVDEDDTAFFTEVNLLIKQNEERLLNNGRCAHHMTVEADSHSMANAGRRIGFDGFGDSVFEDDIAFFTEVNLLINRNAHGVGERNCVHDD
jgi:hypothetical protein